MKNIPIFSQEDIKEAINESIEIENLFLFLVCVWWGYGLDYILWFKTYGLRPGLRIKKNNKGDNNVKVRF